MDSLGFRTSIQDWAKSHGREFPWRSGSLSVREGLVVELLLRKTTAHQVSRTYDQIIGSIQAWDSGLLSREALASALRPLGLHRQRTEAVVSLLQSTSAGSDALSGDLALLLGLPSIGPYVANAVRCFCLRRPSPIVDANVGRVFARYFGIVQTKNPVRTRANWLVAAALVGDEDARFFNWGLLDFSNAVCIPKAPRCDQCRIRRGCSHGGQGEWDGLNVHDSVKLARAYPRGSIPDRIAELSGSAIVAPWERLSRRFPEIAQDPVTEQTLRHVVLREYCASSAEKVEWTVSKD